MSTITVYQKPTCTKCRSALKFYRENDTDISVINYFDRPIPVKKLKELYKKINLSSPKEMMRDTEPIFRELGINKNEYSDEQLFTFMEKYPDLIQRPIVEKGDKAWIARSPELLEQTLK